MLKGRDPDGNTIVHLASGIVVRWLGDSGWILTRPPAPRRHWRPRSKPHRRPKALVRLETVACEIAGVVGEHPHREPEVGPVPATAL
jgi:hypothetical protein